MSRDQKPDTKILSDEVIDDTKAEIVHGTGYMRPPPHTQFKKGQSGNPKGRPKANQTPSIVPSSVELTLKEARRMVTVREGDKVHRIPAIEAVVRAQYASATKGSAYAQKHIIETHHRAERVRLVEIQESNERWVGYVRAEREKHAHAARNGLPTPTSLPHPDDVVIDSKHGVQFIGPWDEESEARLSETLLMRDVLIMQDVLQQREDGPQPDHEGDTAIVVAMCLNAAAPRRHRLSDTEWTVRMMRLQGVTKCELRKRIAAGWSVLGLAWLPDHQLPSLSRVTAMLDQLVDAYLELQQGEAG